MELFSEVHVTVEQGCPLKAVHDNTCYCARYGIRHGLRFGTRPKERMLPPYLL